VAPAAGVAVLGTAVTVATAPESAAWQPAQFPALGVAWATGAGLIVTTMTAAANPDASTAIFGMLILFRT
jgi:hypothetical protein